MIDRSIARTAVLTAITLLASAGAASSYAAPAQAGAAVATSGAATQPQPVRLSHGRFKDLRVYRPEGPSRSVALLISGDEGWNSEADVVARRLIQQGVMVIGIDYAQFKRALEADGDQCESPDGDLENLSHFAQAYLHAPTYEVPLLVGISGGASFVYAMMAQAPHNTFAAALGLSFCPIVNLEKPLCKGTGLETIRNTGHPGLQLLPAGDLGNPFLALQGESMAACPRGDGAAFTAHTRGAASVVLRGIGRDFSSPRAQAALSAAYSKLAEQNPTRIAPPPADLRDLPVIEVAAQAGAGVAASDLFAVILSGDGGWAGLDKDVAAALTEKGLPVVGLDSLRYFWTARTPEGLATDIDRLIRYYLARFGKQRVLLIGYSQGADVLPFALNRLPPASQGHVALAAVMGMSEHALFEFHVSNWLSDDDSGLATLPEIERIRSVPLLCIYGEDEGDSLCPKLDPRRFTVVKLKGGHHFNGDYAGLARSVLAAAEHR